MDTLNKRAAFIRRSDDKIFFKTIDTGRWEAFEVRASDGEHDRIVYDREVGDLDEYGSVATDAVYTTMTGWK